MLSSQFTAVIGETRLKCNLTVIGRHDDAKRIQGYFMQYSRFK